MSNLSKMLSAVWGLLGLITMCTLFVIYANFPEYSRLDFQGLNMNGQTFFYAFTGLFLIVNLMVYVTVKTANGIGRKDLRIPSHQKLRISVAVKTMVIGPFIIVGGLLYLSYILINPVSET